MTEAKRPKPQDHLAKGEATQGDEPVTFEYEGQTYTLEPGAQDNLELFEAIEDEKYLTAMRGFLGREGWNQYKESHRGPDGRVPMTGFDDFLNAMTAAMGGGTQQAPN